MYDYLLEEFSFNELYYEELHSKMTKKKFLLESEGHPATYNLNPDLMGTTKGFLFKLNVIEIDKE